MTEIRKKLVTDELSRPVAVLIDYADWLDIEARLSETEKTPSMAVDLGKYAGTVALREDPLEYQARIRREWG